jgi:hypothetical protein
MKLPPNKRMPPTRSTDQLDIRKGDRFRALHDVPVSGVVTFGAPFSSAFEGVFPTGAIAVVDMDPLPEAKGVYLVPEEYERPRSVRCRNEPAPKWWKRREAMPSTNPSPAWSRI